MAEDSLKRNFFLRGKKIAPVAITKPRTSTYWVLQILVAGGEHMGTESQVTNWAKNLPSARDPYCHAERKPQTQNQSPLSQVSMVLRTGIQLKIGSVVNFLIRQGPGAETLSMHHGVMGTA